MSKEITITVAEYYRRMESLMEDERLPGPSDTVVMVGKYRVRWIYKTPDGRYDMSFYNKTIGIKADHDMEVMVSEIPY